jgi:hypothetical protein
MSDPLRFDEEEYANSQPRRVELGSAFRDGYPLTGGARFLL